MTNTTLNALNNLIAKHPQVENAFYAVTLYNNIVNVQGHLNSETLGILKDLGVALNQHAEQLWFEGAIYFNETHFKFTLTA
jgi:hypothetical protein